MAEIIRYGAYLPRHRAPLKEIQSFFGRPGRPRAKALATPALDEDALTMAYEAAVSAIDGADAPGTVITVSQAPPFGLRKLSGPSPARSAFPRPPRSTSAAAPAR